VPDVRSLLHASDVFCLLSRTEGLPNVVLEAMACALPTVATRVGGTPEVVDEGLTGFLVENEDHAGAAQRVLALLAHPAARQAMGQAARARVMRDFTAQSMIEKHVEIYDSLLRR
jgi:glycosyltransferase involved in cell wall biosynthesis